jgi:sulfite exporter TauE/SafE
MRIATSRDEQDVSNQTFQAYRLGLLWGLLPCGLVLTALFTAAVSTSLWVGAARMLAFGLGTLPALIGVRWLADRGWKLTWPRYGAAALMLVFGVQFAFRGLASFGVVNHLMYQGVMLW